MFSFFREKKKVDMLYLSCPFVVKFIIVYKCSNKFGNTGLNKVSRILYQDYSVIIMLILYHKFVEI